jgi:hypothetical protein
VVGDDPSTSRFVELFDDGAALRRRRSPGAAGPLAAPAQAERLRHVLDASFARLEGDDTRA